MVVLKSKRCKVLDEESYNCFYAFIERVIAHVVIVKLIIKFCVSTFKKCNICYKSKYTNQKQQIDTQPIHSLLRKILCILSMISLFLATVSTVNAGLTASTSQKIKGSKPVLIAESPENKLAFTVGGTEYSEKIGNIYSDTVALFDASLKFSDFVVKEITANDFSVSTDYGDDDGDDADPDSPFTFDGTSFRWVDGKNTIIPDSDYGLNIGCESNYSMPLTLEITTKNVQVHSQYGDPKDGDLTTLTKKYVISVQSGFCYAKPNAMIIAPNQTWEGWNSSTLTWAWQTGSSDPNASNGNGGGYSADFDPVNGFRASATTKFPTTGFPGAQFQLIMAGSQSDYNYAVDGSEVSVDTLGNVLLKNKPAGNVTITATLKNNASVVYHYTFNPTTVWAIPLDGRYNWAASINKCGSANNILTRGELTNSPRNSAPQNWVTVPNYYTRAIDGTIFSEWGRADANSYPKSKWIMDYYWTSEIHKENKTNFVVHSLGGHVESLVLTSTWVVACRG